VLGVVVVFDDQAAVAGPSHQLAAPFAFQHHPGRELMCRGKQDGRGAARAQLVHPDSVGVDRDRRGVEQPVVQLLPGPQRTRILNRYRVDPGGAQDLRQ